jgi:hypothetical protein
MRGNSPVDQTLSPGVISVEKHRRMRFHKSHFVLIETGKCFDRGEAEAARANLAPFMYQCRNRVRCNAGNGVATYAIQTAT